MPGKAAQLDATIEIVTPENIAFDYRVAGPFRRLPAFVIDVLIRAAVIWLLAWASSVMIVATGAMWFAFIIICWFLLEWFYAGVFETYMNGQTPGKWMMGIRVLSVDGEPINGMQAVMRNILRTVDAMPLLPLMIFGGPPVYVIPLFCVGLGAMTLNRRFQRLGDLVCGTMVVIEERGWLTGVAKIDDLRAVQLAAYLPTDLQVSRPLAKALATYVERRRYFSQARRREVARHLGQPLLVRFGLPADTSHDLLLCAMYYRTFIADRGKDEQYATGQSPYAAGQSPYAGLTAVDPAVPSPLIARTP